MTEALWHLALPLIGTGALAYFCRTAGKGLLFCDHKWGFPRRRGDIDMQVCTLCGHERESRVQFGRAS